MGATYHSLAVGFTVLDSEHLPDGVDPDDVVEEMNEVVDQAVRAWYELRGKEFLACEPG